MFLIGIQRLTSTPQALRPIDLDQYRARGKVKGAV
jgi:hypothetical protein